MSDKDDNNNNNNEILGKVYQLQLEQTGRLGRMEGEIVGINTHLKQIDTRLEVGSSTIHDQGGKLIVQETMSNAVQKRIDAIEVTQRECRKECSSEFKRLGGDVAKMEDLTGPIIIGTEVEKRTKLAVWKRIGAVITIALSIASAFKLGECITAPTENKPAATRKAPTRRTSNVPATTRDVFAVDRPRK